jgi:hypothetical protein
MPAIAANVYWMASLFDGVVSVCGYSQVACGEAG